MSEENLLLRVRNLRVYYYASSGAVKAVDGASIEIGPGEIVGLVGESGCGKTTLGLSVMRLIAPPGQIIGGVIEFDGTDLLGLPDGDIRRVRGSRISAVFQDPMTYLNPVLKIKRQIAEPLIVHQRLEKSEAETRSVQLLRNLQIAEPQVVAESYPHQLSGGMLQRCMIAIALSCGPALLIADEPTTALDVTVQAQILDLLLRLRERFGMGILLITHDLGIVAEICDRVYVMYAGKTVEDGSVFSVLNSPLHPYTQGLLSSILSVTESRDELATVWGAVPSLSNPPPGCRFHPRCPYAMDICRQKSPATAEPERSHKAACWLY